MDPDGVVRAQRFELVDDEGNVLGYMGADLETGSIGIGFSVRRDGQQILAFVGMDEWEPTLGLRTNRDGETVNAAVLISEGKPRVYLKDADGNEGAYGPDL